VHTAEEAAEILKVKQSWLERQAAARKIPFTMLGGSYRFSDRHLAEIVQMNEMPPAPVARGRFPASSPAPGRRHRQPCGHGDCTASAAAAQRPAARRLTRPGPVSAHPLLEGNMAYAEKRGNLWRARWRAPDGTLESKPGFTSRKDAETCGRDQEAAIRTGAYVGPRAGQLTLTEWVNA
jgi:excisionase family DNA binding protein